MHPSVTILKEVGEGGGGGGGGGGGVLHMQTYIWNLTAVNCCFSRISGK